MRQSNNSTIFSTEYLKILRSCRFNRFFLFLLLFTNVAKETFCYNNLEHLTSSNFNQLTKEHSSICILFYAPWCPWSKRVIPLYLQARNLISLQQVNVQMVAVDITKEYEIQEAYNVIEIPSLLLLYDNKTVKMDGIPQKASEIVRFVLKFAKCFFTIKSIEQFNFFQANHQDVPIFFFYSKIPESKARQNFMACSQRYEDSNFLLINDASLVTSIRQSYNKTFPTHLTNSEMIFSLRSFPEYTKFIDDPIIDFNGDLSNLTHVFNFVQQNKDTIIYHLKNIHSLNFLQNKPFIYILFSTEIHSVNDIDSIYNTTYFTAKKMKNKFNFVYCETSSPMYQRLTEFLDVHESSPLDSVRIAKLEAGPYSRPRIQYHFRLAEFIKKNYTQQLLIDFLINITEGQVKPYIKSEPPPNPLDNQGPVFLLVASEYEKLVVNSTLDIVLQIHAPWCGHCRQFDKTFNLLAHLFEPVKNIQFMKMDGTLNEVPFVILGYPTIVFITNDSNEVKQDETHKKTIFVYKGTRSPQDLAEWITTHSSQAINLTRLWKTYESNSMKIMSLQNPTILDEL